MPERAATRRLVAILAADIAGYSRLMGDDEDGTVLALKGHQAVVLPLVGQFGGHVIDTAGDGILAEFPSVIHAVECAVEIQRNMAERNRDVPDHRRMQFRIGINLGDVLHDESRIYGDGINVAARLENLAEPGGICVSSKVREEIGERLPLTFRDLGPQKLKNIAHKVRVYAVAMGRKPASPVQEPSRARVLPRTAIIGAVVAVTVVFAITFAGDVRHSIARLWTAPVDTGAGPASRPFRSMVVMPIEAEDRAVAERLTEDLTSAVTRRFPEGLVISSGMAAKYHGDRDVRAIGRELNVRYVVEARFGASGSNKRVDVKLIDSFNGAQMWSDSQPLASDSDTLEVVAKITNGMRGAVLAATEREIQVLPERQRAAWEALRKSWNTPPSIEAHREYLQRAEEALRLDPNFVEAMLMVSQALFLRVQNEPERRQELVDHMDEITLRATLLAPRDPRTWQWRQFALMFQGNIEGGLAASDEALRLDPLKGFTVMRRGAYLTYIGRAADALPLFDRALSLDPALKGEEMIWKCFAYLMIDRDRDAVAPCEAAAAFLPYWTMYGCAAAAQAGAGNMERAVFWRKKLMAANPRLTIQRWRDAKYSPAPEAVAQFERWLGNLAKTGVPEK
jgi:adenylate cyclase